MSIWCNNVVLNSSSLVRQLLLQQPPPWPCTPSAPAWVWRGTASIPLACNTQHSAHYMILENNISSKLNMRKNMIVLTSDCQLWCRLHCGRHRSCHPTLSSHSAYYYTILETETKCDCAHLWLWYRLQFISDQGQDFLITDHRPSVIGTLLEGLNGCRDITFARTLLRQTSLLVPELRP